MYTGQPLRPLCARTGCPQVAWRPLCARNGWPRMSSRPLCARTGCPPGMSSRPQYTGQPSRPLRALPTRGAFKATVHSGPLLRHRGARACVCATRPSEKLLQASVLGYTKPCIILFCCTLDRAWICMGSLASVPHGVRRSVQRSCSKKQRSATLSSVTVDSAPAYTVHGYSQVYAYIYIYIYIYITLYTPIRHHRMVLSYHST